MTKAHSTILATIIGASAFLGIGSAAQAVELGIPSQAITSGLGWENVGDGTLTFPANGSSGFTAGSFDFNGSGPGGTYTNDNFVSYLLGSSSIVQSGAAGPAFLGTPLALTVTFDYNVSSGNASFGLSNNGTSLTTVLSSALNNTGAPTTLSLSLNPTQLATLNSSTTFAFTGPQSETLRFSNFRFDVTPVPFEFNPALGVIALAGAVAMGRAQKNSKKTP